MCNYFFSFNAILFPYEQIFITNISYKFYKVETMIFIIFNYFIDRFSITKILSRQYYRGILNQHRINGKNKH